jgi:hypothetical protein
MKSIWYKREGCSPEVVDRVSSDREAHRLAYEYSMAFGTLPGQHRHGKDVVWAGRKDQQP